MTSTREIGVAAFITSLPLVLSDTTIYDTTSIAQECDERHPKENAVRPAEELRYAILALQREGNRALAAGLKPLGVTPAQAEVLRVLEDYAPLTLAGLGELLLCETGTGPSRLVDRLVTQGFVLRTTDISDRRSVTLTLSAEGRGVVAGVAQVQEALYAAMDEATTGAPVDDTLAVLRALLAPLPSGAVLDRRAGRLPA
jgi:DNA-binding MarR family transcriptional regulator